MKKLTLTLVIAASIWGCSGTKTIQTQPKIYNLQVEKQYDSYGDSLYFNNIRCMQFYNDSLYLLDTEQMLLLAVSENFDGYKTIAKPGRAANEIAMASKFFVARDTIFIPDQGKIKYYSQDKLMSADPLDLYIKSTRFYCDDKNLYFPLVKGENTFCAISKSDVSKVNHYGSLEKSNSEKRTERVNSRFIFQSDKYLVTLPEAYPYFEYFDSESMEMIGKVDLSWVGFIKDNIDYIDKQSVAENSFYVFVNDAYLFDNELFVLYNTFKDGYQANTILTIDISSEPEVGAIYKLPGNAYSSISVDENHIAAFNCRSAAIEYFALKNIEK